MDLDFEQRLRLEGYKAVCGIDEAGRGPLAGPVCVAAVILPEDFNLPGLNDSKKLSAKKREELFELIKLQALAFNIVFVDEKIIDEINILKATLLGMKQAKDGLKIKPDIVLVDGNAKPDLECKTECIIKGDSKISSIAAASILAKVSRDKFMEELALKYPGYFFEKHKGYGTKEHYEAINKLGICDAHRRTFCKKILGENVI